MIEDRTGHDRTTDREWLARRRLTGNASMDIPVQDTQGSAAGVWRTQRRGETALGAAWRWARRRAVKWKLRTRSPRFLTHRSGKGACGCRARRSRSAAGNNGALITHARLTGLLCRRHEHGLPADDHRPKKQLGHRQPHTHSRFPSNARPDRLGRSARPRPAEGRHRPGRAQPTVRATGALSCGRKTNTLARKRVAVFVDVSPRRCLSV